MVQNLLEQGEFLSSLLGLTKEGAELALRLLEKYSKGEEIIYRDQDTSLGKCYFQRQWRPDLAKYIVTLEQEGMISRMLRMPATRVRQPIIEL